MVGRGSHSYTVPKKHQLEEHPWWKCLHLNKGNREGIKEHTEEDREGNFEWPAPSLHPPPDSTAKKKCLPKEEEGSKSRPFPRSLILRLSQSDNIGQAHMMPESRALPTESLDLYWYPVMCDYMGLYITATGRLQWPYLDYSPSWDQPWWLRDSRLAQSQPQTSWVSVSTNIETSHGLGDSKRPAWIC